MIMKNSILLIVVVTVVVVCIGGIYAVMNYDQNNTPDQETDTGITGTFAYTVSGQNDTTNQDYSGSSVIVYKNGEVTRSTENIDTTASAIVLVRPGLTNLDGYDHIIQPWGTSATLMTINSTLSDCHYCGTKTVNTNYGYMELYKFYKTVDGVTYHYYAADNGIIYKYTTESSRPVDFERTYMLTSFTN